MRPSSGKAKGRRFQVEVAEIIAKARGLTIEAVPPTKAGFRNGVQWVPEGTGDLRVRRMGEAGCDVALISHEAREKVTLGYNVPLWIECKNTEAWTFDAGFWRTGQNAFIHQAMEQTKKAIAKQKQVILNWKPVLVLSKNRWPALAVWHATARDLAQFDGRQLLLFGESGEYYVTNFLDFVDIIGKIF